MWRRQLEILGLLLCILGWGFVGCTLAMDHWRVAQLGGRGGSSVVTTAWFWSDLWRDCYQGSGGVVNCVDLGVLWSVKPHIQAVRGLLIMGLSLGLVGTTLAFFGLECTWIGGEGREKDRALITASAFHLLSCLSNMAAFCLYINTVLAAFLHSKANPAKLSYEMGPALYLGLVGSFLALLGCSIHCMTACRALSTSQRPVDIYICQRGEGEEALRGHRYTCRPPKMSNNPRIISTDRMASVVTV